MATIQQKVSEYAARYGINDAVAQAQIWTESRYNPRAYNSGTGASGLAQFIPATWASYGRGGDPFDVDANLDAWGRYLRDLLNQFGGDYTRALIAYFAGPEQVEGVLRNPKGNPLSTDYYKGILTRAGSAVPTGEVVSEKPANEKESADDESQLDDEAWMLILGAGLVALWLLG